MFGKSIRMTCNTKLLVQLYQISARFRWLISRMDGWLMNDHLERIWNEVLVTYSRYYQGICLEELRRTWIFSIWIAGIPAESQTKHLPSTSLHIYRYNPLETASNYSQKLSTFNPFANACLCTICGLFRLQILKPGQQLRNGRSLCRTG